jgi:hypothetical protein
MFVQIQICDTCESSESLYLSTRIWLTSCTRYGHLSMDLHKGVNMKATGR